MNERIKELAEQAGMVSYTEPTKSGDSITFDMYNNFNHEKFAELLIRECARFVNEKLETDSVEGGMIRDHFGAKDERTT